MDGFFLIAWMALVYMVPTIIAAVNGHKNVSAIAALNILLGWTFIGWVGALIWTLKK